MIEKTGLTAAAIRDRLSFDVERLRGAVTRLEAVDRALVELKARLEQRATRLADDAHGAGPLIGGDGRAPIAIAQAQATANLARRAALGEVLASSSPLALIAAMAARRWVSALQSLSKTESSQAVLKSHVDAGRIAHRMLVMLRPRYALRSGVGQLVSAVVVAEFLHPSNREDIEEQIEEGLHRARFARGVRSEEDAIAAASRALRAFADLVESKADRAEPAARRLLDEAEVVEERIAEGLLGARGGATTD
jgi:hypothetical protein